MSPAQTTMHWKLWSRACAANGWRMEAGRLIGAPETALGLFARRVWVLARQRAESELRGAVLDDLRHAVYELSCGRTSSRRIGTGKEFTWLRGWLLLVADDADVEAARMLDDSPEGTQEMLRTYALGVIGEMQVAHGDYVEALRADMAPGMALQEMPTGRLALLARTLRERMHGGTMVEQEAGGNEPF